MINLSLDLYKIAKEHPQDVMKRLGIQYKHATPQSMADKWWFWSCTNVPEPLPPCLSVLKTNPNNAIGYGLSKENAKSIIKGSS